MVQLKAARKTTRPQVAGLVQTHRQPILSDRSSTLGHTDGPKLDGATIASQLGDAIGPATLDKGAPLFITDLNGELLYANSAYRSMEAALSPTDRITKGNSRLSNGALAHGPSQGEVAVEIDGHMRCFALELRTLVDPEGTAVALPGRRLFRLQGPGQRHRHCARGPADRPGPLWSGRQPAQPPVRRHLPRPAAVQGAGQLSRRRPGARVHARPRHNRHGYLAEKAPAQKMNPA